MTSYGFTTGGATVLPGASAAVFFDGMFSAPRLQRPECVAIGPDGFVWAGNENGQILRIAPDGSAIEEIAAIAGFTLGLAFDGDRALFACEMQSAAACRLDLRGILRIAADGGRIDIYIEDATAHLLAHPTNIAFDGAALFTANLGRWHITRVATDTTGARLCDAVAAARRFL